MRPAGTSTSLTPRKENKPYPNQVFTVLIWGENRSKFGTPESEYKGKRVCVTGKITEYKGAPEIVASDPRQISLDERPSNP